jgi:hypothetical protein
LVKTKDLGRTFQTSAHKKLARDSVPLAKYPDRL